MSNNPENGSIIDIDNLTLEEFREHLQQSMNHIHSCCISFCKGSKKCSNTAYFVTIYLNIRKLPICPAIVGHHILQLIFLSVW